MVRTTPTTFPLTRTDSAGTTIYTSQGSVDERPTLAYNATTLRTVSLYHEVRSVRGGTRIALDVDTIPSGATADDPEDLSVQVVLRRV